MRIRFYTALSLGLGLSAGCSLSFEGDPTDIGESQGAIVGGAPTTEYPAVAFLYSEFATSDAAQICSGTLISPRVILTAAHCVEFPDGAPERYLAYFGSTVLVEDDPVGFGAIDIASYEFHPDWDINNLEGGNDIGLVLLDAPATGITAMSFNRQPIEGLIGEDVHLVGWGRTDGDGDDFGIKREVTSPLAATTEVLMQYGSAAANTCQGDSGGPNFMTIDGAEVIAGITSFGNEGCDQFGAGTRVDHFVDSYILPYLEENDPTGVPAEEDPAEEEQGDGDDTTEAGAPTDPSSGDVSGGCSAGGEGDGAPPGFAVLALAVLGLRLARRRMLSGRA